MVWVSVKLLGFALVIVSTVAAAAAAGAQGQPQAGMGKPVRYTVAVQFRGEHLQATKKPGGLNVMWSERVTTWRAGSKGTFAMLESGSGAQRRYSFRTVRLSGPISHRGNGEYSAGGIFIVGECKRQTEESEAGRAVASAAISLVANRLIIAMATGAQARVAIKHSSASCVRDICDPQSMNCPPGGMPVPAEFPERTELCKSCFVWPDRASHWNVNPRKVRMGRAFTLTVTDKSLLPLPFGGLDKVSYRWVLRFSPASGR